MKNWSNIQDVELQVRPYRPWVINMLPLAKVDEKKLVAETAVSATYTIGNLPAWVHNPKNESIWVENVLEGLDQPGEWVVNTKTRKIYLWPKNPNSNGSPQAILAPTTSELIRIEGAIDYDGSVDKVVKESTKETYENWKVREKYNHSRHNLFEYNEITHSVQKLSDGNAIYISGAGTSNIIRYNYIHDNLEHSFPAAIRCDDDQHETVILGNVLYNNYGFSAGIASKGVNDIINNFIVKPLVAPKWGYISFEWVRVKGSKIHHNIIVSHSDGGNAYGERPIKKSVDGKPSIVETDMDSNLYYHSLNSNWMDAHFTKMHSIGKEQASVFANPMFVNATKGNFKFKEGSPAIKLGIETLDVSKMGLLD